MGVTPEMCLRGKSQLSLKIELQKRIYYFKPHKNNTDWGEDNLTQVRDTLIHNLSNKVS